AGTTRQANSAFSDGVSPRAGLLKAKACSRLDGRQDADCRNSRIHGANAKMESTTFGFCEVEEGEVAGKQWQDRLRQCLRSCVQYLHNRPRLWSEWIERRLAAQQASRLKGCLAFPLGG